MTFFWRPYLLLLSLTISSSGLTLAETAPSFHSLEDIAETARSKAHDWALQSGQQNIDVRVNSLDPRLTLPNCAEPLTATAPATGNTLGPVSISVKCHTPKPWTLYVRATVTATKLVPTLNRIVTPGSLIQESDINWREVTVGRDNQMILEEADALVNHQARQIIHPGVPVRPNQVKAPLAIKRGQVVSLISEHKGLSVIMSGKALQNARAGDVVEVVNLSSGKKVVGIAQQDSTVKTP